MAPRPRPYLIDTLAELQSIDTTFVNDYTTDTSITVTNSLSKYYRLTADINVSGSSFNPIGGSFTGTFDGRGQTIQGLRAGLFAVLGNGGRGNERAPEPSQHKWRFRSYSQYSSLRSYGRRVSMSGTVRAGFTGARYSIGGLVAVNNGTIQNSND